MPLDGGRTLGEHRLLGDNKTIRGFIVIVPAASLAFGLLAWLMVTSPAGLAGLWPLTPAQYALVGAWGALGFMAGELPNSFVKRRLGIRPGAAAEGRVRAPLFSVVDRIDSIVGLMLALMVVVPVPWGTWLCVVLVGPALHGLFSVALFRLGVKVRPA
jgi:CDP-2,3-bis-(O-geranylgeranyl)-sn-glycerol synthase